MSVVQNQQILKQKSGIAELCSKTNISFYESHIICVDHAIRADGTVVELSVTDQSGLMLQSRLFFLANFCFGHERKTNRCPILIKVIPASRTYLDKRQQAGLITEHAQRQAN